MDNVLVSVVIPSYNRPLFLRERSIPSVLAQDYPHWELLVIGDGPLDGSLRQAAESFGDPRIRYEEIPRPDYSGLTDLQHWHAAGAAARNRGLELCRGQVIAPLDDDDEFLPNHLREAVRALSAPDCDLVYGSVIVRSLETGKDYTDYFPWDDEPTRELFKDRNIMFHSSVCYTHRFAGLRYPTDGHDPADYALWCSIVRAGGRIQSLQRPQSIYYGDRRTGTLRLSVPTVPPIDRVQQRFAAVLDSRQLSNDGQCCQEFERAVAGFVGAPFAVSTPSGDLALLLAFSEVRRRAGRRRKVLLPSYAHASAANAVRWNGLEPVFCDLDADTLCLAPTAVESLLDDDVAAILAVDAHGNPSDKLGLEALAHAYGAMMVSDAAAAFGASVNGRRVGGFGDIEVFSFSGTKVLTTGEGGMLCCRDEELAASLRCTGRYGSRADYVCERLGINAKLAEIPAALGLEGLGHLDGWLAQRRRAVQRYRQQLDGIPGLRFQRPVTPGHNSTWKDMALITSGARAAQRIAGQLAAYRIDTRPYYRPLHRMPAFQRCQQGDLSTTERLADAVVCVPLYSDVRDDVVDLVARAVREVLS